MHTDLKKFIRSVPDFPKPGIDFKDVSPLLGNPDAFGHAIGQMKQKWDGRIDAIAVLDARGFIFGGPLAHMMCVPLVMLRKEGKLPGKTRRIAYGLEYGNDTLEVQEDAFLPGARVLVVDDLLATGGTAAAACSLVEQSGAVVEGCAFIVELAALGGRKLLNGWDVHALVNYES